MSKTRTLAEAPNNSALAQVGEIKMWPVATPPTGYLMCDGSQVSRTTYAALFALVGTTFGAGDGSTTFNLPNYTNRMAIGAGGLYGVAATGGSKDAIAVAHTHSFSATTGNESANHTHSGTTDSAGTHAHSLRGASTVGATKGIAETSSASILAGTSTDSIGYYSTLNSGSAVMDTQGAHTHTFTTGGVSANHTHSVSGTTGSTGSSGTDANLPPYLAIFFIIKH